MLVKSAAAHQALTRPSTGSGFGRRMHTMGYQLLPLLAIQAHSCVAAAAATPNSAQQLLEALQQSGYLSDADALAATKEFAPLLAESVATSSIAGYLSLANFIKVIAIALLLAAFLSVIANIAQRCWKLIEQVPVEVWQGLFLTTSLSGLLSSPFWAAPHSFYLALFCAFANLIIAEWIVLRHDTTLARLEQRLRENGPVSLHCLASFLLAVYFGVLAIGFKSEVFGFFTAVCVSAMTSFVMHYSPYVMHYSPYGGGGGMWSPDFGQSVLNQVVFGNLIVVAAHVALELNGVLPVYVQLFKKGVNFYCTQAVGVGFLVGASPYRWLWGYLSESEKGARRKQKKQDLPVHEVWDIPWPHPKRYLLWFIMTFSVAMKVYFLGGVKSVPTILCVYAVLLALEWIVMYAFHTAAIVGMAVVGVVLYGGVWLLESGPVGTWLWSLFTANLVA